MEMSLAGTVATHAKHIEKIKKRKYVELRNGCHFVPSKIGRGLVEGYNNLGCLMFESHLRAELEADLKRICEGTRNPKVVLTEQLAKYKEMFWTVFQQVKCSVVANVFLFVCNNFSGFYQASKVEMFTCSAVCVTSDAITVMGLVDYNLQTMTEPGILQS
jgi:hypothetical protein